MKHAWVLLLLIGCATANPPAYTTAGIELSDAIVERLSKPFIPLPGGQFTEDTIPRHVMRGSTSTSSSENGESVSRRAIQYASFGIELENVDFPTLWNRLDEITPRTSKERMHNSIRSWEDVVKAARVPVATGVLEFLGESVARFYAHRLSGLTLTSERDFAWHREKEGAATTLILHDVDRANVVQFTVLISVPSARSSVSVTYFAHLGDRVYSSIQPAPVSRR